MYWLVTLVAAQGGWGKGGAPCRAHDHLSSGWAPIRVLEYARITVESLQWLAWATPNTCLHRRHIDEQQLQVSATLFSSALYCLLEKRFTESSGISLYKSWNTSEPCTASIHFSRAYRGELLGELSYDSLSDMPWRSWFSCLANYAAVLFKIFYTYLTCSFEWQQDSNVPNSQAATNNFPSIVFNFSSDATQNSVPLFHCVLYKLLLVLYWLYVCFWLSAGSSFSKWTKSKQVVWWDLLSFLLQGYVLGLWRLMGSSGFQGKLSPSCQL